MNCENHTPWEELKSEGALWLDRSIDMEEIDSLIPDQPEPGWQCCPETDRIKWLFRLVNLRERLLSDNEELERLMRLQALFRTSRILPAAASVVRFFSVRKTGREKSRDIPSKKKHGESGINRLLSQCRHDLETVDRMTEVYRKGISLPREYDAYTELLWRYILRGQAASIKDAIRLLETKRFQETIRE